MEGVIDFLQQIRPEHPAHLWMPCQPRDALGVSSQYGDAITCRYAPELDERAPRASRNHRRTRGETWSNQHTARREGAKVIAAKPRRGACHLLPGRHSISFLLLGPTSLARILNLLALCICPPTCGEISTRLNSTLLCHDLSLTTLC